MKIKALWLMSLLAGVAFVASAGAKVTVPPLKLKIGDPAPALEPMAWIKGEPVKQFQPGHVYVVEFWATWCGPCNSVMPHLSELQKKHAKDLTIIGVNVRESQAGKAELAPVTEFVKKKGEKMAYTVAMDDPNKKTVFDTWMTAGGSYGIPTSFIVGRDGKLAWVGYPTQEDGYTFDVALADALAGKSDLAKARELQATVSYGTAKRLQDEKLLKPMMNARSQKDYKQMLVEIDKVVAANPEYASEMFGWKFGALLHTDEAQAMKLASEHLKDAALRKEMRIADDVQYWGAIGRMMAAEKDLTKTAYLQAAGFLQKSTAAKPDSYYDWMTLAKLQHQLGNTDQAIVAQERAVSTASAAGAPKESVDSMKKTLDSYKTKGGAKG